MFIEGDPAGIGQKRRNPLCVVVTGGPCSGKTTVLERLKRESWFSDIGVIVPETATEIIARYGLDANNFAALRDPEFVEKFQMLVLAESRLKHEIALQKARKEGKRIIVFDRHVLDGAAYVGGMGEFLRITRMSLRELVAGLHGVLYLEPPPPEHYVQNEVRKESHEEARALGTGVFDAWCSANALMVVQVDGESMDKKYDTFVRELQRLSR